MQRRKGADDMAEVIIELELNRRSGVLAAAIAALRHLSLSFTSQQLREQDGSPWLILTAEGQVNSLGDVEAVYAPLRGISAVIDVRVEGQSLVEADQETGAEFDGDQSPDSQPLPATVELEQSAALAPQPLDLPVTLGEQEVLVEEETAENGTDRFSAEVFARHVLIDAASKESTRESVPASDDSANEAPSENTDSQARGALKPAMFRRRRRLR